MTTSVPAGPRPFALFDLDDTLIDRQQAFAAWLRVFADRWRLGEPARRALVAADLGGEAPRTDLLEVARGFGVTDDLDAFLAGYQTELPQQARPFPGVIDGLTRLRHAGWRTGIVTNGTTRAQHGKVAHAGLAELVDAVVVSEEVDLRKPDPRIFTLARDLAGAGEHGAGWMVGDLLHTDVAGGASAGLHTLWIRLCDDAVSARHPSPEHVVPDVICGSAAEAFAVLLGAPD